MTGYYDPATGLAVEFYKGTWINRCRGPDDRPASENPEAEKAVAMWLDINRRKRESLR